MGHKRGVKEALLETRGRERHLVSTSPRPHGTFASAPDVSHNIGPHNRWNRK